MQLTSLKTLAAAVLTRNRQCNQSATDAEKTCNFLPQNIPPMLHKESCSFTVEEGDGKSENLLYKNGELPDNKMFYDVEIQEMREEGELHNTPYTPESCTPSVHRGCNHATQTSEPVAQGVTDASGNCESCPVLITTL